MLSEFRGKHWGPFLVGVAAMLWATDALVRYPASGEMDPTFLVFIEHAFAIVAVLPYIIKKYGRRTFELNRKEWASAAFSGIGGSALATLFFTASFAYVNPSVSVLLQKLQPIIVVLIAFLFLGERPNRKFYFLSVIALAAGTVLSFPDLNFQFIVGVDLYSKGIRFALGAAFLWASSTVAGKILLERTPAILATFWRFFFGLIALGVIMAFSAQGPNWSQVFEPALFWPLIYLSLVPGLLAFFAYYGGLAITTAGITTFVELLFPIGAVILNTAFLHTPLNPVQLVSGTILVIAVTLISL